MRDAPAVSVVATGGGTFLLSALSARNFSSWGLDFCTTFAISLVALFIGCPWPAVLSSVANVCEECALQLISASDIHRAVKVALCIPDRALRFRS
jgi:hypothetical protein